MPEQLVHAPENEFETRCGLPLFDVDFAGAPKHITCPACARVSIGVICGRCGGAVYMLTCNSARGTGHDWVLASVCVDCRAVHWTEGGCESCRRAVEEECR